MTSPPTTQYELPAKVEALLATLSMFYAQKKEELLQRVVVNAAYTVEEGHDYDNWNGGQWGHLVRLAIPAVLFLDAMDALGKVEQRIAADLNRIAKCPNENISAVTVEPTETEDIRQWREKSGALLTLQTSEKEVADAARRLWAKGFLRAFVSHKAGCKQMASGLKTSLLDVGVSAFVAHEDIEPTKEWQNEIELALSSQDVCVALLTDGFHDSKWTDQEIGIAIGRGVPVVSVRCGQDPYGFIGKFQAVAGVEKKDEEIADELVRTFLGNDRLRQRMAAALVLSLEQTGRFISANRIVKHLKTLHSLSADLIQRLEQASEQNSFVRGAYGVQHALPGFLRRLKEPTVGGTQ